MKSTSLKLTTGAAGLAIVLGILLVVNYLASRLPVRADFTQNKLYTLSDGTKTLLKNLDRDVTLKFYYSRSLEGVAAPIKQYAQRIQDLLREFERNGHGKIVLEMYDPKPDSDEEEWAQKYGMQPQSVDPMGQTQFYLGLVAQSGTKEAAAPYFAASEEDRLEYDITRQIAGVVQQHKPVIGLMTSLPVMGGPSMSPYGGPQEGQPAWVFITELQNQYDIEPVSPMAGEIPTNIDTLLVIHPREASDATLFALDQFVMRGGRMVAFLDSFCTVDQADAGNPMGAMGAHSDLNKLTQAWGIEMDSTKIVNDQESATRLRGRSGRPERNPAWLSLRNENMNKNEIAVGSLNFVMMPFAGAFKGKPADGLKMDVLAQTSSNGVSLTSAMSAMMGGDMAGTGVEKMDHALPLAIRLSGKFKTAFPNGRPKAEGDTSPAPTNSVTLKESVNHPAVVLVSDVDMLADNNCVEKVQMLGYNAYQLFDNNIAFVNNLVEQTSGSEILLGLRSRGTFRRPFDRVIAMEAKAETEMRGQLEDLQKQRQDVQQKLAELQRYKSKDQQRVVSPEQKKEIEKFNAQNAETGKKLRKLNHDFNRDIEALGMKLKVINIAAVPLLVALFGLFHGLARRRKALT